MLEDRTVELEDAIRFRELLSTGAQFRINHENLADSIDPEIFDEAGSGDEDDELDEDIESKLSPWKKSFAELKRAMEPLENPFGEMFKRIITQGRGDVMGMSPNIKVKYTYSMFLDGDELAFDSKSLEVKRGEIMLEGKQLALGSMKKQEEAQFLISYKLMYREMGCPPRIKPKADILLVVKLNDFIDSGDADACETLTPEDRRKFHVVREKIDEMNRNALDHMRNKRYGRAIPVIQKAIRNLEFSQLANEDEQSQQQKMLIDLYTELGECHFKVENWKKVCLMVNELRRRSKTHVNQNVDILVNEAVAISHIEDDYTRSIRMLRDTQRSFPSNERLNRELNKLLEKKEKYDAERKAIWSKAFQVKAKADGDSK